MKAAETNFRKVDGVKNRKIDDDMRTTLERLHYANPLMTLVQMKQQLQARLPHKPTVSTSTIARTLNGMLITLKLAEDVPDQRNAARVLDARRDYANWFLRNVLGHVVYIDETGYNIMDSQITGKSSSWRTSKACCTSSAR